MLCNARGSVLIVLAFGACQSQPVEPTDWRMLPTGTTASFRGLSAVDANVAYVSGSGGTILRTTDGGKTWANVAPPGTEKCDFRDIEAFDRDEVVAMVAGQPARVYRTDDGGENWQLVHEDPRTGAFFDAIAFSGDVGMMFGDAIDGQFSMLQTNDRGRTWSDRSGCMLPAPKTGEAAFAASGTCLVAKDAAQSFSLVTGGGPSRSITFGPAVGGTDGKHHWTEWLPLQTGAGSKGAFSVAWRGERGVAVGGDYAKPELTEATVAVTADGGATWQQGDALGFRSAVIWLDDATLLAVGSHGASYSPDSGRTWQAFGKEGFHCLSVGRDGSVWASGGGGRVARLIVAR